MIDDRRFRIVSSGGQVETSLDNGATTLFGSDHSKKQTPLVPKTGPTFGVVTMTTDNENLTVGSMRPGPTIAGVATQAYTVTYTYESVTRFLGIATRRIPAREQYQFYVAEIGASPAASRVVLSRGFGERLATLTPVFRGFPLLIDGILQHGDGASTGFTTRFRMFVVSIAPWSWTDY